MTVSAWPARNVYPPLTASVGGAALCILGAATVLSALILKRNSAGAAEADPHARSALHEKHSKERRDWLGDGWV